MNYLLTPLKINLLIHMRCFPEKIPNVECSAQQAALMEFIQNDIAIHTPDEYGCGYKLTYRGRLWLEMITKTPMPEKQERWIDPRNGEEVK